MQRNVEKKARHDRWHVWTVPISCAHCTDTKWKEVSCDRIKGGTPALIVNVCRLNLLFRDPARVALTSFVYLLKALLPFAMVRLLVRTVTGQREPADYVTARLVTSPTVVSAAVKMGADEMRIIKDLDQDCQYPTLLLRTAEVHCSDCLSFSLSEIRQESDSILRGRRFRRVGGQCRASQGDHYGVGSEQSINRR